MKFLLVLTITLSLTQVASAGRWRGLIASVAALESAKTEAEKPLTFPKAPKPDSVVLDIDTPDAVSLDVDTPKEYKKVCDRSGCRFVPDLSNAEPVKPSTNYTTQRFRLFRRLRVTRR